MVVKKQIAKSNVNLKKNPQNKQKVVVKKPAVVEESDSEDNVSFDDMSEDELKKMLGNSSNSDLESCDFSEEEVQSTEAKVNKKRKMESDDEDKDNGNKKLKTQNVAEEDDEDIDSEECDEDDSEDEDEDMEEDSFIDDKEDEEVEIFQKNNKKDNVKVESVKTVDIKNDNVNTLDDFNKIYEDTPRIESESLRKEVSDRLIERKNKTLILLNLPYKFNYAMAKEMIPDLVSIILPFDIRRHQIKGNAYVDVEKPEQVEKYCSTLNGMKIKNHKITCLPFTKVDDNVDNYNCIRLVISNLPVKTTTDALKRVMSKASSVRMMPMKKSDRKMTLVAFADYPCVEDAIFDYDNKHGVEFEGLPINVKFQSRSNTNVKKSIVAFDKKGLHILGINKSISTDDLKKLFPQAIKINWKIGDQMATVDYANAEDCNIDMKNAIKNKPSPKMKIFYKFDRTKNPDKKALMKKSPETEEKKTFIKPKKDNFDNKKSSDNKRGNKKNFQKNKSKFEGKDSNGVKKPNFKNSKKRTVKNVETGVKNKLIAPEKQTQKVSLNAKVGKENLNKDIEKPDENRKNDDGKFQHNIVIKSKSEKRKIKKLLRKKHRKTKTSQ